MTGRDRARTSPFWATALNQMQPGPRRIAQGLHALIGRSKVLSPYLWIGSGYRTGSSEHSSGRALDIIITADTGKMPTTAELSAGNQLVNWLIRHASQLGIHGIIFSRDSKRRPQIWGYSTPGKWRDLPARGSISGDHVDHIHIYFKPTADWPASLNSSRVSPGLPSVGDTSTGAHLVGTVSVAHLKASRYADPPKPGNPLGPYANEVFTMETALAKTKWMHWQHVDGHFGTSTVGDGSTGYGGTTGFQRKHSGATKPDGWLGPKELEKLFRLAGMSVKVTS